MRNTLLIIGIILILGAVTNPKKEEHNAVIKSIVMHSLTDTMDEELNGKNDWGAALGLTLGSSFIDKLLEGMVEVDNYLICSIGNLSYQGESKAITIGIFGNVFLLPGVKDKIPSYPEY
jgi:hypothetical protein